MKRIKLLLGTIFILLIAIPAVKVNATEYASVTIGDVTLSLNNSFSTVYALTDAEGNITTEGATEDNYNICFKYSGGNRIIFNNATVKASDTHGIYSEAALTIEGKGKNVIISHSPKSDDTFKGIYSKDKLTISGQFDEISAYGDAIYGNKGIEISGTIGKINSQRNGIYAVYNGIVISGKINELNSGDSGIYADSGAVTISGNIGKIVNEANYVKTRYKRLCGIHSDEQDITITGSIGDITVTAKQGITHPVTLYGLWSYSADIIIKGSVGNITVTFDDEIIFTHAQSASGMLSNNIEISGSVGDMTCDYSALSVNGKITVDGRIGNISCSVVDNEDSATYCSAIYANGGLYKNSNGLYINGSVKNIEIFIEDSFSDYEVRAIYTTDFQLNGSVGNITSSDYGIYAQSIYIDKDGTVGNIATNKYGIYSYGYSTKIYGKAGNISSIFSAEGISIYDTAKIGTVANGMYSANYGNVSISGETGDIKRISGNSVAINENAIVGDIPNGISSNRGITLAGTTGDIGGIDCFYALTVSGNIKSIYGSPAIKAYGGIVLKNNITISSPVNAVIKQRDPNSYNLLWYTVFDGNNPAKNVLFSKRPSKLTVNKGSGSGEYETGNEVTISADTFCTDFKEWQIPNDIVFKEGNKNSAQAVIIMPNRDLSITAVFEEMDASKHVLAKNESKKASCTENGYKEFYSCSCGKYYTDKNRTKIIPDINIWKQNDGLIKCTGHRFFSSWTTETYGTPTMNGLEKKECNTCDYVEYRIVMTRKYPFGDVNTDGSVTAADARLALRTSVNLEHLTSNQYQQADYNEDGNVTAADARLILRLSVNLEKEKLIEDKYAQLPNLQEPIYK